MQRLLLLPITACLALREQHAESLSDLAAASLSDVAASLSDLASGEPGGFANRTRAGVKGICQGSSPVYGHMLDALGPRAPLELTVVKCFVDYFGKSSVDAVARCIKAAFQAAFPNYIASVNIVNFRMTTSTETGYVLQGSSEDCELFIVWDFGTSTIYLSMFISKA
mmetsp:Transcript_30700/g.66139  ORF Transcript_30700/g.66139 Transcript_30700/m.66139 type:complete len:167 (+) Transcript_30700:72-572(+)